MGDESVNIRYSATKSLNSVIQFHSHLIKPLINDDFWNILKHNLKFDENLIIEVDYGISKEKKDLARQLRIESFNMLKYIFQKMSI